jgi:hypothetical protein
LSIMPAKAGSNAERLGGRMFSIQRIALRRPADYLPTEGARFEVHLEKARGAPSEAMEPFEAMMHAGEHGGITWTCEPLKDVILKKAAHCSPMARPFEMPPMNWVCPRQRLAGYASGRLLKG